MISAPTVLRGGAVDVDVRRAARVAVVVCVAALLATAVALFFAGAAKNDQLRSLRSDGVPVIVTVTGCQGLMGGSGSNLVGYSCAGTFDLDGRGYQAAIPGDAVYAPGTRLDLVTQHRDPGVLATPSSVAAQGPTASVFVLPAVLLALAIATIGAVIGTVVSRRRKSGGIYG